MFEIKISLKILATMTLLLLLPACNLPTSPIEVACSVAELIDAINDANANNNHNTLELDPDCEYILTAVNNTDLYGENGLPAIITPITINGHNAMIRRDAGAPDFRIFYLKDTGELTLNDLTIENGFAEHSSSAFPGSGGAIYNSNSLLEVNRCNLVDNEASFHGGAIFSIQGGVSHVNDSLISQNTAPHGGGIFVYHSGQLTISGSTIANNDASTEGGGINVGHGAELIITDSTISNNHSVRRGGGIFKDSGDGDLPTTITNTIFEDNTADWSGGGVFIWRTPLTIVDSQFIGNQAGEYGGGLGYQDDAAETVQITNTTFDGNIAALDGGGVHFSGELMTIEGGVFQNNQAENGGGIHNGAVELSHYIIRPDTTLVIHGSALQQNTARTDGGGVFNEGALTVEDSAISGNETMFRGGGICNLGGTTTIHNSTVDHNSSTNGPGGGIVNWGGVMLIDNDSRINDNDAEAGGGIWETAGSLTVVASHISSNTARGSDAGGGIGVFGSVVILEQVTLENNTSLLGSAIHLINGELTLTDCQVINNHASGHPTASDGAIRNNEGVATILNSFIEGNTTEGHGGGIANLGEMSIHSSRIASNTAGQDGGGIFNEGGLTVMGSTFADNITSLLGGGIHNTGEITIQDSTFEANIASADGGGINTYSTATVTGSTFVGNTAFRGGGLASVGGNTLLTNNTFSANTATDSGGGLFNMGAMIGGDTSGGGAMQANHVTVAYNSAPAGGGIAASGGLLEIKNAIVAYSPSGADCAAGGGDISAIDENLDSDGSCAGFMFTDDPLLAPLGDNGGPTHTHALQTGSPAIDAAPDCTTVGGAPVPVDQRGVARPGGAFCDLGAYETKEGTSAAPPEIPVITVTTPFISRTPTVTARQNATCRFGPGKIYHEVDYLLAGQTATVEARTQDGDWLQIAGPNWGRLCWIWVELLEVEGDIGVVPIRTPPPTPTNTPTLTPTPTREPKPQGCWWQSPNMRQAECRVPCPNDQYSGEACSP